MMAATTVTQAGSYLRVEGPLSDSTAETDLSGVWRFAALVLVEG